MTKDIKIQNLENSILSMFNYTNFLVNINENCNNNNNLLKLKIKSMLVEIDKINKILLTKNLEIDRLEKNMSKKDLVVEVLPNIDILKSKLEIDNIIEEFQQKAQEEKLQLIKNNQQLIKDNQQLIKDNKQLTEANQQLIKENQQLTEEYHQLNDLLQDPSLFNGSDTLTNKEESNAIIQENFKLKNEVDEIKEQLSRIQQQYLEEAHVKQLEIDAEKVADSTKIELLEGKIKEQSEEIEFYKNKIKKQLEEFINLVDTRFLEEIQKSQSPLDDNKIKQITRKILNESQFNTSNKYLKLNNTTKKYFKLIKK